MKIGDKVKCIKSHPDLSGFGISIMQDFIEGEIYNIVDVHQQGYDSTLYSVVVLCDPVTNHREYFYIDDDFEEYFVSLSELRRIKLAKINFDNQCSK